MLIKLSRNVVAIFAISLLGSGCISTVEPIPVYFYGFPNSQSQFEPTPNQSTPMPYRAPVEEQVTIPRDDQKRKPSLKMRENQNWGNEESLIIGDPYEVNGQTFIPKHQPNYIAVGMASWSGKKIQGMMTAIGEPFDRHSLTAAHPTLPLNALVEVTNLTNEKSLVLRINDRGPFTANRIINVSERAAKQLGFLNGGLGKVRVKYIGAASVPKTASNSDKSGGLKADRC